MPLDLSKQVYLREEKTLRKQVAKENEKRMSDLKSFCSLEFDCEKNAENNLIRWVKWVKRHSVRRWALVA